MAISEIETKVRKLAKELCKKHGDITFWELDPRTISDNALAKYKFIVEGKHWTLSIYYGEVRFVQE